MTRDRFSRLVLYLVLSSIVGGILWFGGDAASATADFLPYW